MIMTTLTKDHNSGVNQDIKRKFVGREVLTCFSYEMGDILKLSYTNETTGLPTWEDIENLYVPTCSHCGDIVENDNCECGQGEVECEPQEIFEWWIVTSWFYEKLKEQGQPVLEWGNNYYWGRCCTGQAILLDSVISRICSDMEILQGMANDWSK